MRAATLGALGLVLALVGCGCGASTSDPPGSATPAGRATTPAPRATSPSQRTTTSEVALAAPRVVADVAAGCRHACARTADGGVACWGDNQFAQLGRGSAGGRHTAARVSGLSGVVEVAATCFSTCVRLEDGTVRCWGHNASGEAGDGSEVVRPSPVVATGLSDVVMIDGGDEAICAVTRAGRVYCQGRATSNAPRTSLGTAVTGIDDATQVAVGEGNVCALRRGGTIVCWGSDADSGELGDGATEPRTAPTAVVDVAHASEVSISGAGGCARVARGELRCWGFASTGREPGCASRMIDGPSGVIQEYCPRPVRLEGVVGARQVALGTGVQAAVLEEGRVLTWNAYDARPPTPAGGVEDALLLAAGSNFVCVRRRSGAVACWGSNESGQLGDGTTQPRQDARDVVIP
ncbi:MAG: hypothetical protein IT379_02045 [Deltaproteobacteria bacterium]|nr:hypothetical protein [Deltaproteobacteria bacterium]